MTLVAVLALTSCSSDSLVGESPVNNEAPIAFTVSQRNTTRDDASATTGDPLQSKGYTDFGVWAYKYKEANTATGVAVMNNYKVAYTSADGSWDYVGKVEGQVERYWDLSYNNTKFFAYAAYQASGVTFDEATKIITVPASVNQAGTTKDFIYATKTELNAANSNGTHDKVKLQFKHLGAKVNIAFREDVKGYKVELIDVKSSTKDENGIQLTPTVYDENAQTKYTKGNYTTGSGATIKFGETVEVTPVKEGATTSSDNLVFDVPTDGLTAYPENTTTYKVLPEVPTSGDAKYAVSPTTYFAVVQPSGTTTTTTGFTIHVSYKLIAEDNGEEIIVRDARAFIPASQAKWESNKAYTYNFTIKSSATGNTSGTVDLESADPTVGGLLPIVFDQPTIVDYENAAAVDGNI